MAAFLFVFLMFLLPSKSYMSYKHYDLSTICKPVPTEEYARHRMHNMHHERGEIFEIKLFRSTSAVLVDNKEAEKSHETFHHCEFVVFVDLHGRNSSKIGLFATIRKLNLRKNINGDCIDYIDIEEFSVTTPKKIRKLCGTINGSEDIIQKNHYLEAPNGHIKVYIYIGPFSPDANEIKIELTFTPFEDCETSLLKLKCHDRKCISESLYNDSIVNCIPPHCIDEPRFHGQYGAEPPTSQSDIIIYNLILSIYIPILCCSALLIVCWLTKLLRRNNENIAPNNINIALHDMQSTNIDIREGTMDNEEYRRFLNFPPRYTNRQGQHIV